MTFGFLFSSRETYQSPEICVARGSIKARSRSNVAPDSTDRNFRDHTGPLASSTQRFPPRSTPQNGRRPHKQTKPLELVPAWLALGRSCFDFLPRRIERRTDVLRRRELSKDLRAANFKRRRLAARCRIQATSLIFPKRRCVCYHDRKFGSATTVDTALARSRRGAHRLRWTHNIGSIRPQRSLLPEGGD